MDYDGGVFLWNIIFKTCKALAADLLQLHQIFTLSLYFTLLLSQQLSVFGYFSLNGHGFLSCWAGPWPLRTL